MKEVDIGEPDLAPHKRPRRETSCSQAHAEVEHAILYSAAHAHDDLCPEAATSHCCEAVATSEAGGDRTDVSMQSMTFPCTHACCGVPRLVSGTMRACRVQTQHSRALLPTLPWTRRARCCRRRDEGMCSSATVEAVGTRP